MKILPLVYGIKNDIANSGMRLKEAGMDAFNVATRTAKIYHQGEAKKYLNITKRVSSKVIKSTTKNELPYVAGAIGLILPVPLMCPLFFGLGCLARIAIPSKKNNHSKDCLDTRV